MQLQHRQMPADVTFFCVAAAAVTEHKTGQLNDSHTAEVAMTANQGMQLTKLQVSGAVTEAASNNLQQHALHVTTSLDSSRFQCTFHQMPQVTCTSMMTAMQQQGVSQAARKQLMWVIQLASSNGWSLAQKMQMWYKSTLN
jgi:hypothetical protein